MTSRDVDWRVSEHQTPRDGITRRPPPEQAAGYLEVNRETIYRYIREGKLVASRLGRTYRIPRPEIDALLLATRTRPNIPLRLYSDEELAWFFEADELDEETQAALERWEAQLKESQRSS